MSFKLIKDATVVTLSDPVLPVGIEGPPRQRITYSGGGSIRVATLGLSDTRINPHFERIPDADALSLISFIQTTVSHSDETFTVVTWAGVTYTDARYIDGKDTWKKGRGGRWTGQLSIRIDLGA